MRLKTGLLFLLLAAAGAACFPTYGQVTGADYQRADKLSELSKSVYNGGIIPQWIGESHYFSYLNHEPQGDYFYLANAAGGSKRRAFKQEALAVQLNEVSGKTCSPTALPFKTVYFKRDLNSFEFEYDGFRWEYRIKNNKLTKLGEMKKERLDNNYSSDDKAMKRVVSPDSLWVAYNRDNNLCIARLDDDKEYVLSTDGTDGLYYSSDIEWSPDSKKIAVLKVRRADIRRIPLLESAPKQTIQPVLHWRNYTKPGDVLLVKVPALFDVATKSQIPLNTAFYENQFELWLSGWRKDSQAFTFEFNQRGHQRYQVVSVDATDGAMKVVVDEKAKTFIHYGANFRHDLADGKEIIWLSERDGWRQLYLIDGETGSVKQRITTGEWVVREVMEVDEKAKTITFTASGLVEGEDPYNVHYIRINMDGSGFIDLTPENGNHKVSFSADKSYFTDVYSRPDMPYISLIKRTSDGSVVAELQRGDISAITKEGYQPAEVFSSKGRDGKTDIWGTILRPSSFDETKRYPVVEMIYAGPHGSHVGKDFTPYYHLSSRLSELGFIVVMIDGMGTANRSKAFHDVCWKNLKDAGFPDRIAWIKAAAEKYACIDTTRVGIYGWSAGGQNAMGALLFHNDFYKVAVSLCGCHDNRMDKIWWNEQWMGYPIDESYSQSSNVDNAHRLKGKLLLINGELDDNVDPASTLQVVDALIKANKDFEQLYLPGYGHSLGGKFEMRRIHDFFVRHLMQQQVPAWE